MPNDLEKMRLENWRSFFPFIQVFFYFGEGYSLGTLLLIVPLYVTRVIGVDTDTAGIAVAFAGIPWLIKIIYGVISDRFAFGKYGRRKPYLLLISITSLPLWLYFTTLTEFNSMYLGVLFVISTLAAFADTVLDGYVVDITPEAHQQIMQSAAWSGRGIGTIFASLISLTLVASNDYILIYQIAAGVFFITTLSALGLSNLPVTNHAGTIKGFKKAFGIPQTKYILLISALMGAGQVMYTFASVVLDNYGFSDDQIRNITTFYFIGNVLGAFLIGATDKLVSWSSEKMLIALEILAVLWSPLIVISTDQVFLSGFFFGLGMIMTAGTAVISKITMEYSPVEVSSSMFALFASVNNFGLLIVSPIFTGYLLKTYSPVIVVNIAAIWFVLAALFLWRLTKMKKQTASQDDLYPVDNEEGASVTTD